MRMMYVILLAVLVPYTKGTDIREMVLGEQTPVSVEQSHTPYRGEEAENAIDRDMDTYSSAHPGEDGTTWLKVKLGQVYCIEKVKAYWFSYSYSYSSWSCTRDECTCERDCEDSLLALYLYTEGSTSSGNVPSTTGCRLGDSVKLYRKDGSNIDVHELVITTKLANCTTLENVVTDPPLPVEHGTAITLKCTEGHLNMGEDEASCQDGVIVPTPQCFVPCPGNKYRDMTTKHCAACPPGNQASSTQSDCERCRHGTYIQGNMTTCTMCPENTISNLPAVNCTECPTGSRANDARTYCDLIPCLDNQYRHRTTGQCVTCPAGKRPLDDGCVNLVSCHDGEFRLDPKAVQCHMCPNGTQAKSDHSGCAQCHAGTYKRKPMIKCAVCPDNQISKRGGAASCTKCTFSDQMHNEERTECVLASGIRTSASLLFVLITLAVSALS